MNPFEITVLTLAGLIILAMVVWGKLMHPRRRRSLEQLAAEHHWEFYPENKDVWAMKDLRVTPFFGYYNNSKLSNRIKGSVRLHGVPCPIVLADCQIESRPKDSEGNILEDGQVQRHPACSLVMVVLPETETAHLAVRRETLLDRAGRFAGMSDIEFESDEFNQAFFVQASDRRFAFDLFHPRMMQFFLERPPPDLLFENGVILLTEGSTRWEAWQFERTLTWLMAFTDLLPGHRYDDLGLDPS